MIKRRKGKAVLAVILTGMVIMGTAGSSGFVMAEEDAVVANAGAADAGVSEELETESVSSVSEKPVIAIADNKDVQAEAGDITAATKQGTVIGIQYSGGNMTEVSFGGAEVQAYDGHSATVETGNITTDGEGLNVVTRGKDSTANVSVNGNIQSTDTAVYIDNGEDYHSSPDNRGSGSIEVDVSGNINSKDGSGMAVYNQGNTSVAVGGDVQGSTEGYSNGVVSENSGKTTIAIGGNVKGNSTGLEVINYTNGAATDTSVDGNIEGGNSGITVTFGLVPGDIEDDSMIGNVMGGGHEVSGLPETKKSEIKVTAGGDVSGETGLEIGTMSMYSAWGITEYNVSQDVLDAISADVYIEGTLAGEKAGLVMDQHLETDNLNLTVWQITGDMIAARETGEYEESESGSKVAVLEEDEELAKSINYIIKVEQPTAGGILSLSNKDGSALTTVKDNPVSKEGEIYLLVSADDGYAVKAAYNGLGEKVELTKAEEGKYLVKVTRGGGIYLTVDMEQIKKEETPAPSTEPSEEPTPDVTPEPVPNVTPEPAPDATPEPTPESPPAPTPASGANTTEVVMPEDTQTAIEPAQQTAIPAVKAVPVVSEPMATLVKEGNSRFLVLVRRLIISSEELLAKLAGNEQAAAAVKTFVEEQRARDDVIILEVAAIDPEVFGDSQEAIVERQYPQVNAGETVTILFDDGKTETAAADADGSIELTFRQAGAFVVFKDK